MEASLRVAHLMRRRGSVDRRRRGMCGCDEKQAGREDCGLSAHCERV